MTSPIQSILAAFTVQYGVMSRKVVDLIGVYLAQGMATDDAVDKAMRTVGTAAFLADAIDNVITLSASKGAGYTIPLLPELTDAWDPSGMKLSEKLHGTQKEMRSKIVSTISHQQSLNRHAMQAARALYDGYSSGDRVIKKQRIPQYLQRIVDFSRRSELSSKDKDNLFRLCRQAQRRVNALSEDGAPNKALRSAYTQVLNAVDSGTSKALDRAVKTAVEEKSRYVAERIARTEGSRAWADGFHVRYDDDENVAAYRWHLSSRHPDFDICDMYAHADLWGLGEGVYPKDKTPILPVHPHCLCHLSVVYRNEKKGEQHDRIRKGGDEWLSNISHSNRCDVLGIDGDKSWEDSNSDWRKYMRNWNPESAKSRLSDPERG
jgi:hypothetical protein